MGEVEYFVLLASDGRYFRDWQRLKHGPVFHFCGPLACARPFTDKALATSFQRFLADNSVTAEVRSVRSNRLLKPIDHPFRSTDVKKKPLESLKKNLGKLLSVILALLISASGVLGQAKWSGHAADEAPPKPPVVKSPAIPGLKKKNRPVQPGDKKVKQRRFKQPRQK
jgi:hypothetical protein